MSRHVFGRAIERVRAFASPDYGGTMSLMDFVLAARLAERALQTASDAELQELADLARRDWVGLQQASAEAAEEAQ